MVMYQAQEGGVACSDDASSAWGGETFSGDVSSARGWGYV